MRWDIAGGMRVLKMKMVAYSLAPKIVLHSGATTEHLV